MLGEIHGRQFPGLCYAPDPSWSIYVMHPLCTTYVYGPLLVTMLIDLMLVTMDYVMEYGPLMGDRRYKAYDDTL